MRETKTEKKQREFAETLTPNEFWTFANGMFSWLPHSCTHGILLFSGIKDCLSLSFADLFEAARGAGIPESEFSKISFKSCYRNCYYEGDSPDIIASFPLEVFKNQSNKK